MSAIATGSIGAAVDRLEGREKVTGAAKYASEYEADGLTYAAIVQSTIASGKIVSVDSEAVLSLPGVRAVIWHQNATALHEVENAELEVLQSQRVAYRGQIAAAVVADSHETARFAARELEVRYAPEPHDVLLRADHPGLYKPEKVNPELPHRHRAGRLRRRFRRGRGQVDVHLRDARRAQQPDGAARHDRGLGGRQRHAL